MISTERGRQIFIMGHHEYAKTTLQEEYLRDQDNGMNTAVPENCFVNDDPEGEIMFRWRARKPAFLNWLNYYVYRRHLTTSLINRDTTWIQQRPGLERIGAGSTSPA